MTITASLVSSRVFASRGFSSRGFSSRIVPVVLATLSLAACFDDTSTNLLSLQFGQSEHPRPEAVSRTRAPLTTITNRNTVAVNVAMR